MSFSRAFFRRVALAVVLAIVLAPSLPTLHGSVRAAAVPSNKIDVTSDPFVLDTDVAALVDGSGQQSGVGSFGNGSVTGYPEGACLPFTVVASHNHNVAGDIPLSIVYDFTHPSTDAIGIENIEQITPEFAGDPLTMAGDLSDFTYNLTSFSGATSFDSETGGSVQATVTGPFGDDSGADPVAADDRERHYNVLLTNVAENVNVYVTFCARLGVDAGDFPGASMSVNMGSGGAQNTAINPSNLLKLPSLTLTKAVSSGPAAPDEFSFVVSPAINNQSVFDIASGQTGVTIDNISPNGTYSITETGPAGYAFVSGSGTNCAFTGETASANVAAGDPATDASCTFTNAAEESSITVNKVVVNDDAGTAQVSDFPLFVDATSVVSGVETAFAPATYTVSETNVSGYTATFSGDCDANGSLTIIEGQNAVCTITNNDDDVVVPESTIALDIVMVNDDGGLSSEGDYSLFVDAIGMLENAPTVFSPGTYTVTQTGGPGSGYTTTFSGDCDASGVVLLDPGEAATCTITNDDIPVVVVQESTITVTKIVVNDDSGESMISNFPLFVDQTQVVSGATNTFAPGTYTVSENNGGGYTATFSGDCDTNGVLVLAAEASASCTITNNDIPVVPSTGSLRVVKTVVNNDGGTSIPENFTITIRDDEGANVSQFIGDADGTIASGLAPGTYTVLESALSGYTGDFSACGQNGTVTIVADQQTLCSIVNNDNPSNGGGGDDDPTTGTLTVIKRVVGGTASSEDFTLTVSDSSEFDTSFSGSEEGEVLTLAPETYTVSETTRINRINLLLLRGYTGTFSGDCDEQGVVTVEVGESYTCIVTNTYPQSDDVLTGTLVILKHVINDNGRDAIASDFTLNITGTNPSASSVLGDEEGVSVTLEPGAFSVTEGDHSGYNVTYDGCEGTIEADQTLTCTVTNNDRRRSGGGGGGSSPFDDNDDPAPTPTPAPEVLGVTDEVIPAVDPIVETPAPVVTPEPEPQVLGAADALPVTGMPPAALLLLAIPALWAVRKRA